MTVDIPRQLLAVVIDLVQKDLLTKRLDIKRHEDSFFEFKNGSYMEGLRTDVANLEIILKRLEKAKRYAVSMRTVIQHKEED